MKTNHNKKRNALFLYEVLVRELTKSVVEENEERRNKILMILKEYYKKNTLIRKEMECYRELLETKEVSSYNVAEKIMNEIKRKYNEINKKQLFFEQSKLIKRINKELEQSVYTHFVPNYKTLATIYQLFNSEKLPIKTRIILEENLIKEMLQEKKEKEKQTTEPINKLAYKKFIEKFNSHYSKNLLREQQQLLQKYIISSIDDVEFKIYLNEEIERLKKSLSLSLTTQDIASDNEMLEKTESVISILESYNEREIDSEMIQEILKIQNLVNEMESEETK